MSNFAVSSPVTRPNFFKRMATSVNNSSFMERARQIKPRTLIAGGAIIGLGAFLAYLSTKLRGNPSFTPINVPTPAVGTGPKVNLFA